MKVRIKREKKYRRQKRVRAKIFGQASRPRLCVFRSNKHIYAQLVDDEKRKTIITVSDREIKKPKANAHQGKIHQKDEKKGGEKITRAGKEATAYEVGKLIAKKSLDKKIEKVIFDRGSCQYHGRIRSLAEGARQGGLKF